MTTSQPDHVERKRLADFASNHHSQFGEDGIIDKIFEIIGTRSKVSVEFGAWDGFHLSNTANLWTNGWKGVLIEGHPERFRQLTTNVRDYSCVCIHAYVSRDGDNRLEALLSRHGVAPDIDLLSIDIDGNDYYIVESLETLRPRLIVCEYNPTIPAELDLYAEYGNYFGASVTALERIGPEDEVIIVGTGLTMVDMVLWLDATGRRGRITALSRRGLTPRVHGAGHDRPGTPTKALLTGRLSGRLAEARRLTSHGDWRGLMEGLRPLTAGLWFAADAGTQ